MQEAVSAGCRWTCSSTPFLSTSAQLGEPGESRFAMRLAEFDDLLAEISERAFSSAWQSGIEFELWLVATGA